MTAREHTQFLPAALEIQETPPLPVARYILWAIMLFFTVAVGWACVGHVNVVAVAHGKIVPSGRVKIIQPLETGVVRQIFIEEGQRVVQGAPLIELDTTMAGADRDQVREQQLALSLDRARLLSLLAAVRAGAESTSGGRPSPAAESFGDPTKPDSLNVFSAMPDATSAQIRLQEDRARSQLNEFRAQAAALLDEERQRHSERNGVAERIAQLDATIPLVTERAKSVEDLLAKDLVPRVQWLELEQERIEQVKQRDVELNNLAMLDAAIASTRQRQAAQQSEFERTLLTELSEVENRLTAFEQERIKAEQRVTLRTLTSPVAGTVHRLAVHTIGGVVTPAQELMHIIPDEGAVEIEVWIPNRDIGFVHEGQTVTIKVETFPFTKYGTVNGTLVDVSNDATPDENLGLVYAARVHMEQSTMHVDERVVDLSPGMAVTAEVKLGDRRIIEYLLSPLMRYRDESIRER